MASSLLRFIKYKRPQYQFALSVGWQMRVKARLFCVVLTLALGLTGRAQLSAALKDNLLGLIAPFDARVGVALVDVASGDSLTLNGHAKFTMASTYKTPLALVVLRLVDQGRLSLAQKILVTKNDLPANTWSPLQKKFPEGNVWMRVDELLVYTVSKSDNNACDILFRLLGGTAAVDSSLRALGYKHIAMRYTEAEMQVSEANEAANACSPYEMARLLAAIQQGKHLKPATRAFLLRLHTATENSPHRLKAGLPKAVQLAHKTGTGRGEPPATVNDVGLIYLPGHRVVAVAVYINQCKASFGAAEQLIAHISKEVFAAYQQR